MHRAQHKDANRVIQFWFHDIEPVFWFKKDEAFDRQIRQQFEQTYWAATRGECFTWRVDAAGRLAEIIVLDQFARNLFRDSAQAFACDGMALLLAQEMVAQGLDEAMPVEMRKFVYMPYMHSESVIIHEQALKLFSQPGLEDNLHYEKLHFEIIRRFGRYPHRNKMLGRQSTQQELEFLEQPGSSF